MFRSEKHLETSRLLQNCSLSGLRGFTSFVIRDFQIRTGEGTKSHRLHECMGKRRTMPHERRPLLAAGEFHKGPQLERTPDN